MLQRDGEEPGRADLLRLVEAVHKLDSDLGGPVDVVVESREGEAALFTPPLAARCDDLRVDELDAPGGLALFRDVDEGNPLQHSHLVGGEAHAAAVVHGLGHVFDEGMELLVEHGHRFGRRRESGMGVEDDGSERHGLCGARGGGTRGTLRSAAWWCRRWCISTARGRRRVGRRPSCRSSARSLRRRPCWVHSR